MSQSAADGREPETVPPVVLSRQRQNRAGANRKRLSVLLPLVLVAVIAVLGGQALSGRGLIGRHPDAVAPAASGAPPADAEVAAVMGLLAQHAAALRARDDAGWVAGIDEAPGTSSYPGTERAVFGNLARVPLTSWRYVLSAPVTDPNLIASAAGRLGGRVVIVHVQLQYAFAVVDPAPTGRDLWLTAVRRPDGWKLAGDQDAVTAGGTSWRGPWDFGPLVVRTSAHTLVLAHPAHQAELARFGELVERSVPVVTSVWGSSWNDRVAVLIPDTAAEFAAVTADGADTGDLAAVAVADSVTPAGIVLGARIVLNPTNLARLDPAGRRLVVQHELTHVATRAVTSDQMPSWLIEGFADYVGNLNSGQPVRQAAPELAAEVHAGTLPAVLPTDADFDGSNQRLAQVYEESWLACRLVASRAGQAGLVRLYKAVSSAATTEPDTALQVGLRRVLGLSVAGFTSSWRGYLTAQLA